MFYVVLTSLLNSNHLVKYCPYPFIFNRIIGREWHVCSRHGSDGNQTRSNEVTKDSKYTWV